MVPLISTSQQCIVSDTGIPHLQHAYINFSLRILPSDHPGRLVRLIPEPKPGQDPNPEAIAIRTLFNYRLPSDCNTARLEWLDILESTHRIWLDISTPKKELIRSFFNVVNLEIVKRLRPSSRFDFTNASVGNLFLTGYVPGGAGMYIYSSCKLTETSARLFTGSLESAIYMLSSVCAVPASVSVLPAINSNFAHHISAGLQNGHVITGQNNISHPSETTSLRGLEPSALSPIHRTRPVSADEEADKIEDANMPGTLPDLRKKMIKFSKTAAVKGDDDLPARIARLWYINPYGQEIRLPPNPRVLEALATSSVIVYSIGSLYTSIVPSLVLKHIGLAIGNPAMRSKVLILNATNDRETGPSTDPYSALDFVAAIARACTESMHGAGAVPEPDEYARFVTHVIYAEGPASPRVVRDEFDRLGITVYKIPGRTVDGELRYDGESLKSALSLVIGRRDLRADRSRRNTLEG